MISQPGNLITVHPKEQSGLNTAFGLYEPPRDLAKGRFINTMQSVTGFRALLISVLDGQLEWLNREHFDVKDPCRDMRPTLKPRCLEL